jgi:hypothetical protein
MSFPFFVSYPGMAWPGLAEHGHGCWVGKNGHYLGVILTSLPWFGSDPKVAGGAWKNG